MRRLSRLVLVFLIFFFGLISVMTVCCALIFYRYSNSSVDDELTDAISSYAETKFYCFDRTSDGEGGYIPREIEDASLNSGIKNEYVPYCDIPSDLINAFISIEDKRFFDHNGIDYKRSLSAIGNYLLTRNASFGGSTITQQLVKNLTGNDEKKIERKLNEAFCAMELERKHDKSEILEMYLNIINLAHGCRGVEAASRYYFSKNARELDLCECAAIAAITNNPSKYDPQKHPEENRKRRAVVLKCMYEQGYITEEEYDLAVSEEPVLNIQNDKNGNKNSWYIDAVIEDVIADYSAKYGISKQNASVLLYRGGYKIYTSVDMEIQSILEEYFTNTDNFPKDGDGNSPQASMIIIDPSSGDVLGIAGSIGEKRGDRIQNYATSTKRPPGSTIKPLSVYTPAIEQGLITWSSIVEDSPVNINKQSGVAWPSNANGKYIGDVTVKHAVANSLNTVAVKILRKLGNRKAMDFLRNELKMNSLDPQKDIGDAALALGQPSVGVTLRELTAAYSIFQNGIMCESRTYYKVTDSTGRIVLDNSSKQERVISEETAAIMTKLMQTVVSEGTASGYVTLSDGIEVAGKTGTTQFGHDKYFIGYTPSLLGGAWQGYELPRKIDCFSGNYSICIWDDIMHRIYNETSYATVNECFRVPSGVQKYSYNRSTGGTLGSFEAPEDAEYGWFLSEGGQLP